MQDHVNMCTLALIHNRTTQLLDRLDRLDQVQANRALTMVEAVRSEATEVIKVIIQTDIRRHASTLSISSPVEPVEINKDITRVCHRGTHVMEYPGNFQFIGSRRYHNPGRYLLHFIYRRLSCIPQDQGSPRRVRETY
jgi:hypothetical protein